MGDAREPFYSRARRGPFHGGWGVKNGHHGHARLQPRIGLATSGSVRWRRAAVFVLVLSQSRCADRVESTGRFGRRDLRGTSSQIFPPDFPPNSPLQGGKWRYRTVGGKARKPYFSNKTELDVTGQNGPQGFRKPLLYPTELRDRGFNRLSR